MANEVGSCTSKATLKLKGETSGESRFRVATDSLTCFCWFHVLEPPTFTKKIENTVTVLGKMAEFRCVVEGSPTLSVQWQKDDNWILEDPKIERTFENNVAILKIPACEAAHGGKYSCQVVNEAGQTKCSATLTVQGRYSTSHAVALPSSETLSTILFVLHIRASSDHRETRRYQGYSRRSSQSGL